MWSAEQNIRQAVKGVFHKIPGHVLDRNTPNLYTFFSFHTVACTVVFVGAARFVRLQCYLSSF